MDISHRARTWWPTRDESMTIALLLLLFLPAIGAPVTLCERRDLMHASVAPDDPFRSTIMRHPYTIDEYGGTYSDVGTSRPPLPSSSVTPIVMTGSCCRDRARTLLAAWGSRFAGSLVLVSDEADPDGTGAVTLPELKGKPSWQDAQARQLLYAQARGDALLAREDARWFLFADDDTFVNADALLSFAARQNASRPVAFGFLFNPGFWPVMILQRTFLD